MTVTLGLVAALCWGITDLLARVGGRGIGPYRAMFLSQVPGLVVMTIWLALDSSDVSAALGRSWHGWAASVLASLLVLLATFSLYRALAVGTLAIVSPVTASYGAVTAGLSASTGEAIGDLALAGIAVTVAGVALASTPARRQVGDGHGATHKLRGIGWALLAAAGYGVGSWVQGAFAVPALGFRVTVWIYYAMGAAGLVLLAAPTRHSLALPRPAALALGLSTGIFSVIAYLAFSAGLGSGQVAVVTVLSSLSSGVAALLGRAVLGERLAGHQWAGVAAILGGIALINAAR